MYVYIISEPGLLTVGFYDPKGKWHADGDYGTRKEAAERVHYLNGGVGSDDHDQRAEDESNYNRMIGESLRRA